VAQQEIRSVCVEILDDLATGSSKSLGWFVAIAGLLGVINIAIEAEDDDVDSQLSELRDLEAALKEGLQEAFAEHAAPVRD
jgi:hypothetical protein